MRPVELTGAVANPDLPVEGSVDVQLTLEPPPGPRNYFNLVLRHTST